jgi:hypothetical protein
MRHLRNPLVLLPVIFIVFLMTFLWGAAPSVFYGDSGELQTVALCGGVAHPTGYPTFILLGQVFGKLLGGDPARRITVMSAFFAAAAVCILFLALRKFGLSAGIALAGSVVYGLSFTFWWSAIRTEVYTLSVFLFLISLWLVLHTLEKPTLVRAASAAAFLGLTMTGHHCFAPAVLVLGLMIAFKKPAGMLWAAYWPVIVVAFIAGLTPYAYLIWADSSGHPVNYLNYSIELSSEQYGLTEETFSDPFRRIFWLVRGGDATAFNLLNPGEMARTSMQLLITQFIYQFGIVALPVFILGIRHLLKAGDKKTWVLLGTIMIAAAFCVAIGNRRLLPIFAMPITIAVAIVISFGLLALRRRFFGDRKTLRLGEVSLVLLFLAAMIATPHLIRGPWDRSTAVKDSMKMLLEAEPDIETVIPTLRNYMEPRIYGERVLQLVPPNSLVVGLWDITALYYLHHIEGMRPDIELEPYHPEHYIRLKRWDEKHDLATHPIVFVGKISKRVEDIACLEKIPVDEKNSIYICRVPFSNIAEFFQD